MEYEQTGNRSTVAVEYVSTSVPASFVVVKAPAETEEVGGVRPGDLVVVDQQSGGSDGATVVFRYAEKPVFGECIVRDGEWFVRDGSGTIRKAADMIHDGATYGGAVKHVVRPNKESAKD